MAQRVVHHVAQVLAPDCAPLFLTDGFREYLTALLTHYGHWVQPPRRQAQGPAPKPRWMPLPQLLYAQVVKTVRRRRLVDVQHRVVFGTLEAVQQVLAACGWQINTAFVERLNLSIRQHVAAVGRRVTTLCKGEDGLRQQLALYHVYYNFCLPHASLRQPLPQPVPDQRHGLRQAVAAADAGDGGGADRSRLDAARGAAVSACHRGRSQRGCEQAGWWEAARRGGLSRRRASARPASRASPGVRGPLGGHESPLV